MTNDRWDYVSLQTSDLPNKAQRFISMMDIDISQLRLLLLTPCPDGAFIKCFDKLESRKPNRTWMAVAEFNAIYFFHDYKQVGIAIHELTHTYFTQARFLMGMKYDLQAMGEKFIAEHGKNALSGYAQISIYENAWEEVICEIVAAYGRRGQFNKIKELLNQQTASIKKGGI